MNTNNTQTENTQKKGGKILKGVVVSDKMQDSIVVEVERYVKHPKYGKYIRQRKKYTVHDAGNTHVVGDKVTIVESRPISKTKRFTVVLENKE